MTLKKTPQTIMMIMIMNKFQPALSQAGLLLTLIPVSWIWFWTYFQKKYCALELNLVLEFSAWGVVQKLRGQDEVGKGSCIYRG
jgi:hypothetical protein